MVAILLGASLSARAHAASDECHGIVVEEASKGTVAENADLRSGDFILSWSSNRNRGAIDSPFDLAILELEEAAVAGSAGGMILQDVILSSNCSIAVKFL